MASLLPRDGRRSLSPPVLVRLAGSVEGKLMVSVASVVLEAFMMASEKGASKFSTKRGLRIDGLRKEAWGR